MLAPTPEFAALSLLRGIFDLADADVRPTVDLLGRLTGHAPSDLSALMAQLRRAGLLQMETLGLTMAGLVVATRLPPFDPQPARAQAPILACAASAAA